MVSGVNLNVGHYSRPIAVAVLRRLVEPAVQLLAQGGQTLRTDTAGPEMTKWRIETSRFTVIHLTELTVPVVYYAS